ncbi:hypothetical protein BSKO_12906 [Bryopsis sp. KO-2023]|nr:hypothetical protein BSKO_12906 [Bryopsis sp. KO-2023]
MAKHLDAVAEATREIDLLVLRLEEQGALNSQFKCVANLEDASAPNFATEVVELFLSNTDANLGKVRALLDTDGPTDFDEVMKVLILMKGSNAIFGAAAMSEQCVRFVDSCNKCDEAGCLSILEEQERALASLKEQLHLFLALDQKRKAATQARDRGGGGPGSS